MDHPDLSQHADFLRQLARSLAGDSQAAEDLEQETWLASLRVASKHPRPWMRRVLTNTHSRFRRRQIRDRNLDQQRLTPPAGATDPAEEAAQRELITAMSEAVVGLPEPYRRTVLLRYYSGLSPREIAEQEATPLETVKSRLKRSLGLIRTALATSDGSGRSRALAILAFGHAPGARDSSLLMGSAMFSKKILSLSAAFVLCAAFAFYLATQIDEPASLPEPVEQLAQETSTDARRAPGKIRATSESLDGEVPEAPTTATTASTQTLRGRVWNAHEQPAGGVVLRIRSAAKTPSRDDANGEAIVLAEGLADPDGFFTMTTSDLQPPFHLDAEGKDGARGVLFLTHLDAEGVRVELGLNFRLEGRVRDAEGRPVANAKLSVEDRFGGARLRRETQSDQNGDYCFPCLPSHSKRTASPPMLIVRAPGLANRRMLISGHGWAIAESFAFGEEAILRLDLRLSPATELTGHVRTGQGGHPVKGARIKAWLPAISGSTSSVSTVTTVRTNEEGFYRIAGLPSSSPNELGRPKALIEVSASGFPSQWHVLDRSSTSGRLSSDAWKFDVDLWPGLTLTGRVTDENGEPIPGAVIVAQPASSSADEEQLFRGSEFQNRQSQLRVIADDLGQFFFNGLPASGGPTTDYRLRPEGGNAEEGPLVSAPAGLTTDAGDITMRVARPGFVHEGRVLNLERRPIPGARIHVWGSPEVFSDAMGHYRIEIPPSSSTFALWTVKREGYHSRNGTLDLNIIENKKPTIILIPKNSEASLSGRVLDPQGRPVAHVHVGLFPGNLNPDEMNWWQSSAMTLTDLRGRFHFDQVREDVVHLKAQHPEFARPPLQLNGSSAALASSRRGKVTRDVVVDGSPVIVRLDEEIQKRGDVQIEVLDARSGAPINDIVYTAVLRGTGHVGDRRRTEGSRVFIEAALPGPFEVRIEAKGYRRGTIEATLRPGDRLRLKMRLEPGLGLRGVLQTPEGVKLPKDASIRLAPTTEDPNLWRTHLLKVARDGSFSSAELSPGTYRAEFLPERKGLEIDGTPTVTLTEMEQAKAITLNLRRTP